MVETSGQPALDLLEVRSAASEHSGQMEKSVYLAFHKSLEKEKMAPGSGYCFWI